MAKVVARIAAAALAGTMAAQVCTVLAPAALHTFRFTAAFCHFKNELQQHPLLLKLESAFLESSHAKPTKRMHRSSSLLCCKVKDALNFVNLRDIYQREERDERT